MPFKNHDSPLYYRTAAEAAQQKKLIQILTAGQWVNDDGSLYVACQQGGEEKKQ